MLKIREKNTLLKFYVILIIGIIFYLPFFSIFLFQKKRKNRKIIFFLSKFRNYIGHKENKRNYDDDELIKSFEENSDIQFERYNIDTKNIYFEFLVNIKIIFIIFSKSPEYIFSYIDYANTRCQVHTAIILLINKFKISKSISISADSVWFVNRLRAKILLNSNQLIYYGDRNILLYKNIKKRLCPTNFSSKYFNNRTHIKDRKFDISFIGRIKGIRDREKDLEEIKKYINIFIKDTDKEFLNADKYIEFLNNSKIVVNFNKSSNGKVHFVGKSLEAIASGCLLFEPNINYLKRGFLKPDKDFIEYKDKDDLIKKVNYHLNNINKIQEIADRGRNNLMNLVKNKNLWKFIINNINY